MKREDIKSIPTHPNKEQNLTVGFSTKAVHHGYLNLTKQTLG